jgi:outer membrane protein assembly factor BamB/tetratricopeptide (TPR) repeat protein
MQAAIRSLLCLMLVSCPAFGQRDAHNPVFVPSDAQAVTRLEELDRLIRDEQLTAAARLAQELLDNAADQLVQVGPGETELFIPIGSAVESRLAMHPELLAAWRAEYDVAAEVARRRGDPLNAVRRYRMTPAGGAALIDLAALWLEDGRFHAAAHALADALDHPDASGPIRRDALQLAQQLARYAGSHRHRLPQVDAITPVFSLPPTTRTVTTLGPAPDPGLGEVDDVPFLSRPLTIQPLMALSVPKSWRRYRQLHSVIPSVRGELVYVNDGQTIAAYDRVSLRERWRFDGARLPAAALASLAPTGQPLSIEGLQTVTFHEGRLIASLGMNVAKSHYGDRRVVCLDAASGALRWSLTPAQVESTLGNACVQGPVVVHENVVLLNVHVADRARRQRQSFLAGIDAWSGRPMWLTSVCSTAWRQSDWHVERLAGLTAREGTAYLMTRIGAVAAFDVQTGRPRWVRRLVRPGSLPRASYDTAWKTNYPIITDQHVIVMTIDGGRVLHLSRSTGQLDSDAPAETWGSPVYLLRRDEQLLAVGERMIFAGPLRPDRDDAPRPIDVLPARQTYQGRVAIAGGALHVPTARGLRIVDPDGRAARTIAMEPIPFDRTPLPRLGSIALADGLIWSVTEDAIELFGPSAALRAQLIDRRDASTDISPALDCADAMRRRGAFDVSLESLAIAVERLRRQPSVESRDEIWRTLRALFDDARLVDHDMRRLVLDLLDEVADTPRRRLQAIMLRAEHDEQRGRYEEAINGYTAVLRDAEYREVTWARGDRIAPVHEIAESAVIGIVLRAGRAVYAETEERARHMFAAIRDDAPAAVWERFASTFPMAGDAPRALANAAAVREHDDEAEALRLWLRAVERARMVELRDDAFLRDLTMRIVRQLVGRQRHFEAHQHLRSTIRDFRGRVGEAFIEDCENRLEPLRDAAMQSARQPAVGAIRRSAPIATMPDWRLMTPVIRTSEPPPYVMVGRESRVALVSGPTPARRWERRYATPPALIGAEPDRVLLGHETLNGMRIEAVSPFDGSPYWISRPLGDLAGVPSDTRPVAGSHVVHVSDDVIVLAGSSGLVAVLDDSTGAVRWAAATPLLHVTDVDVAAGRVLLGGTADDVARPGIGALVVTYDVVTGEPTWERGWSDSRDVRWIRSDDAGSVVVALARTVEGLHADDGSVAWAQRFVAQRAWWWNDRLLIIRSDDGIVMVDAATGDRTTSAFTLASDADEPPLLQLDGPTDAVLISGRRLMRIEADGSLQAVDALGDIRVIDAVRAADRIIAITQSDPSIPRGVEGWAIASFDAPTLRLVDLVHLGGDVVSAPRAIAVTEGHVFVTIGDSTHVLAAPRGRERESHP